MELSVTLREPQKRAGLFGTSDRHLRRIRDELGVRLLARNDVLRIQGEPAQVARAAAVIESLQELLHGREFLDDEDVAEVLAKTGDRVAASDPDALPVFTGHTVIRARTDGQRHYIHAMLNHDLVFCVGPAGTGKTYLAVAVAIHLLKAGKTNRIALVRPAVEAGEKLGFLPGDLQQKVNPYLRPLFDAMHDMMTFDQLKRFLVNDVVEVIPLAYMRGRTLNNAVIILDEAQNCTPSQMLMFLTRLGHHSKMIVTGDDSQSDLEPGQPSGLIDALHRLRGIPGIDILRLTDADIIRHRLVQAVVARYADTAAASRNRRAETDNPGMSSHAAGESDSAPAAG
ncbi:MAG: PhoH family protein [Phycisphaerae bacterium]|jgi:phosphate starvation-inducible PhoH-like protein